MPWRKVLGFGILGFVIAGTVALSTVMMPFWWALLIWASAFAVGGLTYLGLYLVTEG